jgi:hypothetical protein
MHPYTREPKPSAARGMASSVATAPLRAAPHVLAQAARVRATLGNQAVLQLQQRSAPGSPIERREAIATALVARGHDALSSVFGRPGKRLPEPVTARMERTFGHDLSLVRVHTEPDAAAAVDAMNARAATIGRHIAFGTGNYDPGSSSGLMLLAHELAHTVQQRQAEAITSLGAADQGDAAPEQEARAAARSVLDERPVGPLHHAPPRLALDGPGPGASSRDDPFGLHLLEPGAFALLEPDHLGLGAAAPPRLELHSKLFPDERYLEREVGADFAKLGRRKYAVHSVQDYVDRAKQTFGSLEAYLQWRPISDELLTRPVAPGSKRRVSSLIEEHGDEQRVFFRWVSWAYHRRGLAPDAIVDTIVGAVLDPALQAALSGAERETGAKIRAEGFNPRPMKDARSEYILGTLSEHATGFAVDIDPLRNPILAVSTWNAIKAAVGLEVDRSLSNWTHNPLGLFLQVAALDRAWADAAQRAYDDRRVAQAGERFARSHPDLLSGGERVRSREDKTPPATLGPTPVLGVGEDRPRLFSDDELRVEAVKSLLGRATGEAAELAALPGFHFFTHPEDRILALRRQGLVWGITFGGVVDLHHFELSNRPMPMWTLARPALTPGR